MHVRCEPEQLHAHWLGWVMAQQTGELDEPAMFERWMMCWGFVWQTLHGRSAQPPIEWLWAKAADYLHIRGPGMLAAYTPLPANAEDILAGFS